MGQLSSRSPEEIRSDSRRYINMSVEEKRKFYGGFHFVKRQDIQLWPVLFWSRDFRPKHDPDARPLYPVSMDLNHKVAIFGGDITQLEVEAIVNSAADPGQGQVNTMIRERAGEKFTDECILNGIPKEGEVMVTAGYNLPAKYVVNVRAPSTRDSKSLCKCYQLCLEEASKYNISVIAFPAIATMKKNGFPVLDAACCALDTVRKWLRLNTECSIELVVFCLYQKKHFDTYSKLMQEYFPMPS